MLWGGARKDRKVTWRASKAVTRPKILQNPQVEKNAGGRIIDIEVQASLLERTVSEVRGGPPRTFKKSRTIRRRKGEESGAALQREETKQESTKVVAERITRTERRGDQLSSTAVSASPNQNVSASRREKGVK